jgi:hypothetical protein
LGDWRYEVVSDATTARFGEAAREWRFALSCDKRAGMVRLVRSVQGSTDRALTIRTETANRAMAAKAAADGSMLSATLPARDPLLDAMALTRGRFAVEVEGAPTLYLPAWAEVTRVIEDCR